MLTIPAKTIVSGYMERGWFASNYNMNIYKGCCHGCIYCDSRSECYGIEDFDTVRKKADALSVIDRDLRSKRKKGVVITGSMSDGYNPFEAQEELTRGALKLIDRHGFGVAIDTKSDLVLRDLDILQSISRHSPAVVSFTVTCASDDLSRSIERSVPPTGRRISALKTLSDGGITCGILLMPVLPFINDTTDNILEVVRMAADAGAKWVYAGGGFGVTLRQNQREHYLAWVDKLYPGMKARYVETYGNRYGCTVPDNDGIYPLFVEACKKRGLLYKMSEISQFIIDEKSAPQTSLFN